MASDWRCSLSAVFSIRSLCVCGILRRGADRVFPQSVEGDRGPGMNPIEHCGWAVNAEYNRLAEIDRCSRDSPVFCWRLNFPSDWLHFGYIAIPPKPEWDIESRGKCVRIACISFHLPQRLTDRRAWQNDHRLKTSARLRNHLHRDESSLRQHARQFAEICSGP